MEPLERSRTIRERLAGIRSKKEAAVEDLRPLIADAEWLLQERDRLQAEIRRLRQTAAKPAQQSGLSTKLKDALWE